MRTNLLNGLSNVVKKGAGLACSWSQVGRMSEEGAIEHPLSTHSAPFGTRWKPAGNKAITSFNPLRLAAMVTLLLTLACGNVWGTEASKCDSDSLQRDSIGQAVLVQGAENTLPQSEEIQAEEAQKTGGVDQVKVAEEKSWFRTLLEDTKAFKKDFLLLLLLVVLALVLVVWGIIEICDRCRTIKDKQNIISIIRNVLAFGSIAALCVYSDSSWCYLVFVAMILLHISRSHAGFIDEINDIVAALQGKKVKTEKTSQSEKENKRRKEAEEAQAEEPKPVQQPNIPKTGLTQLKRAVGNAPKAQFADLSEVSQLMQANQASSETKMMDLSQFMQASMAAERLALNHLRTRYPALEEDRKLMLDNGYILLDGFVQEEDKNTLIEVSFTRRKRPIEKVHAFDKLLEAQKQITYKTRKQTYLLIVFVTENAKVQKEIKTYYHNISEQYDGLKIEVYTLNELNKLNQVTK
ncbi:MAG: hypothetical protein IJR42_00200 [Paludibacteraceae bacterium]|nr:hypothetical protein [Paludibacteraceae bacterium]